LVWWAVKGTQMRFGLHSGGAILNCVGRYIGKERGRMFCITTDSYSATHSIRGSFV
jgi:hypothetical protein